MKMSTVVLVCAAAALPAFAQAETPAPPTMDAATLGRLDALFTACAKADKTNQAVYEKRRAEMVVFGEGTRYEMRAPGSDTPQYKAAYAEVVEAVGKSSAEDLLSECSRMIGADAEKKD